MKFSAPTIVITNFLLKDEKGIDYLSKVHNWPQGAKYFYTQNITRTMQDGADLVFFTEDAAYFFNPNLNYFWLSGNQHQFEKGYVIFSRFISNYPNTTKIVFYVQKIQSITMEDGTITITQSFEQSSANDSVAMVRHVLYRLVEDKVVLHTLQANQLLQFLRTMSKLIILRKVMKENVTMRKVYKE